MTNRAETPGGNNSGLDLSWLKRMHSVSPNRDPWQTEAGIYIVEIMGEADSSEALLKRHELQLEIAKRVSYLATELANAAELGPEDATAALRMAYEREKKMLKMKQEER